MGLLDRLEARGIVVPGRKSNNTARAAEAPSPSSSAEVIEAILIPRSQDPAEASDVPGGPAAQVMTVPPASQMVRLSADGRVSVVGESNYQPAIRAAANERTTTDLADAIHCTAAVMPEPTNPWDPNAVRIDVGGQTVGYLAREVAATYQPALLELQRQAQVGWCPARIMGGGERTYGVFLHLGAPARLSLANSCAGLEMLEADRTVTVTQEERHQAVLSRHGQDVPVLVAASLAMCQVERGKYQGEETVEVQIDGERVGEVTRAMAERYLTLVKRLIARGAVPGCEALITSSTKGYEVDLRLPAHQATA